MWEMDVSSNHRDLPTEIRINSGILSDTLHSPMSLNEADTRAKPSSETLRCRDVAATA